MSERFIPCRIMDKRWVDSFLDGEVFMRSLSQFGAWDLSSDIKSDDENRKDLLEGAVATYIDPNKDSFFKCLDKYF